jgi:uncharacterized membrane protein
MLRRDLLFGTERVAALSDGVFSIILTLLVLELKIPELPGTHIEEPIAQALLEQAPNFAAWIVSFILVARIWIVHHGIVATLQRCHLGTITLNFVCLGFCSLIPFATSLIGAYEWEPLAVAIFSATFALAGISLGLLARHVMVQPRLHRPDAPAADLTRLWQYHTFGITGWALLALALLAVSEPLSLVMWLFEPLVAMFATRPAFAPPAAA